MNLGKLAENGSAKATIETDADRTFFLIDIPCHPAFLQGNVQVDVQVDNVDIEAVTEHLSKLFPSYFQVISKSEVERLAVCLTRCATAISAQRMLEDIDDLTQKQLKNKYLQPLLEMELITMTIPDKPKSRNQKYVLTEKGKDLLR